MIEAKLKSAATWAILVKTAEDQDRARKAHCDGTANSVL
jgi:hypothetical protein